MGVLSAITVGEIKARGSIKDADVLRLRRNYYHDGRITDEEAEVILALHSTCPVQDPAWADYFVETITDYIVEQAKPQGYLTALNANWLMQRIGKQGRIDTQTEMQLLVSVLDKARWVPQSLIRFALDQIKEAILTGSGPLRAGKLAGVCFVTEQDVDLLRRVIYRQHSNDGLGVTKPEAEVLFDIDVATSAADNDPFWRELFVQALTSCIMVASGYGVDTRFSTRARNARFSQLLRRSLDGATASAESASPGSFRNQSPEERAIARLGLQKIEIVTHEPVILPEPDWLAQRLCQSGISTPNVSAVLAFLRATKVSIHPTLQALVDKAAAAA